MNPAIIISSITAFAVVCSVIFAGMQIRIMQQQRSREAELLLARSFQTTEFMKALALVLSLPDDLTKKQVEELVKENKSLVLLWLGTWESLGILVFRKEISMAVMDDFFSGPIIISWRKLSQYVFDERNELNRHTMHEWFQWLAERMIERETRIPAEPAFEVHKHWKE
jgi:hypothetical protein